MAVCATDLGLLGDAGGREIVPQRLLRLGIERSHTAHDHDPARQVIPPRLEPDDLHFDQRISIR